MMSSVKFIILTLTLCFIPTQEQNINWVGCLTKIVCDVSPYVNRCCNESLTENTDYKMAMKTCLKRVLMQEASVCLRPQSSGEGDGIQQQRSSGISTYAQHYFRPRHELLRSRDFNKRSTADSTMKRTFQRSGFSTAAQNEDCNKVSIQPNNTEECPSWSEAAARCVNAMPLIQHFCQNNGMGSGSSLPFHRPSIGSPRFQFGVTGSVGGFNNNGFGGMGGGNFAGNPFGRRKILNPKPYNPSPGDQREYEETSE